MGVVFLRNLGNHPSRKLGVGAFPRQVVAFQEIGKHLVRQHVHCLLGPAGSYPSLFHEGVYPGIGIGAVDIQFVGRYAVVQRLSVEIIQYQYIPDGQTHDTPPSCETLIFHS